MADQDLHRLTELLEGVADSLKPAKRRKVAQKAAQRLQQANIRRIQKNTQPDGTAMPTRKRDAHGKIRSRARMFRKLRTLRYLQRKETADGFTVGFLNPAVARIAQIHHDGLTDKASRNSTTRIRYPVRKLLGYTQADDAAIMDAVLKLIED